MFFHYIWFIDSEKFCFILILKEKMTRFLCLFYCLVSLTLVRFTDQNVYIYYKGSLNIRTILNIFCQYFYGNSIFNVSLNVCLFKRAIFDVM